jgi:hypothetical protein
VIAMLMLQVRVSDIVKHATLRRKSKDGLTQYQDNVSEWGDISIRGLLFQRTSIIKIQLSALVSLFLLGVYFFHNIFLSLR